MNIKLRIAWSSELEALAGPMFIERATRTPEVAAVSRHKVRFKFFTPSRTRLRSGRAPRPDGMEPSASRAARGGDRSRTLACWLRAGRVAAPAVRAARSVAEGHRAPGPVRRHDAMSRRRSTREARTQRSGGECGVGRRDRATGQRERRGHRRIGDDGLLAGVTPVGSDRPRLDHCRVRIDDRVVVGTGRRRSAGTSTPGAGTSGRGSVGSGRGRGAKRREDRASRRESTASTTGSERGDHRQERGHDRGDRSHRFEHRVRVARARAPTPSSDRRDRRRDRG